MNSSKARLKPLCIAAALVSSAFALAACGSSSSSSSAASSSSSTPASSGATTAASQKPVTIGIPEPFGGDQGTLALVAGVRCWAKSHNGTVKTADAKIDPNKQISDFDNLLAQQVNGIVVIPLNDIGMIPLYTKAKAQGVATVTVGITAPGSTTGADVGNFNTQLGAAAADAIASAKPGAKVLMIGGPPQIPTVAQRHAGFRAEAAKRGLTILEQQNSLKATPADAQSIATTMLTQHPDATALWGVNSDIASGGGLAAHAAGKNIYVVGIAASPVAIGQLKAGNISAIVDDRSFQTGEDAGKAIAAELAKQPFTAAPFVAKVFTKANVSGYVPFTKACTS